MTTLHDNAPAPLTFDTAPEWIRFEPAAALAGDVSVRTLRRWVRVGYVRAVKPAGGLVFVNRDSLRRFIEGGASPALSTAAAV